MERGAGRLGQLQSSEPQTLAYALSDSPVGLASLDRRQVSRLE